MHFYSRKCIWKCLLEIEAILSRPQCYNRLNVWNMLSSVLGCRYVSHEPSSLEGIVTHFPHHFEIANFIIQSVNCSLMKLCFTNRRCLFTLKNSVALNSVWPRNAIWWHKDMSPLIKVILSILLLLIEYLRYLYRNVVFATNKFLLMNLSINSRCQWFNETEYIVENRYMSSIFVC